MKAEVLLDTAYAIALSSPNDLFHHCAVQLANELKAAGTRLVTTRAILLEIGNALQTTASSCGGDITGFARSRPSC